MQHQWGISSRWVHMESDALRRVILSVALWWLRGWAVRCTPLLLRQHIVTSITFLTFFPHQRRVCYIIGRVVQVHLLLLWLLLLLLVIGVGVYTALLPMCWCRGRFVIE